MTLTFRPLALASLLFAALPAVAASPAGLKDALDGERIGLLPAERFRVSTGNCTDCATLPQALWYFKDDVIAVPDDAQPTPALPGLVWLGAPQILDDAAIHPDGRQLRTREGGAVALRLVPKIATNQSWWDASTTRFFGQGTVRMRGALQDVGGTPAFVARTVWPRRFDFAPATLRREPLREGETLRSFVQHANGGAASAFSTRLLWERTPGATRQWQDKAAIGIMLNGAQGDDDEAYGGHFAIATGAIGKEGQWGDWIVNNFYNLDSFSEKGIVAAPVPMDNYLMDLNSGQQFYRPSYMLVAVLGNARTAHAYQNGVQRVFNRFYRHDFTYQHAAANCTGISMDVFKALGWHVPERGATSRLKAIGAYAYLAAKEASLRSGRKIYDYLTEEQVRLYPAVAFEAAGHDLLALVGATPGLARTLSPFEQQLKGDVEAIMLVRIPQVPSSRAMGSNPVFSFDEFMARTPPDQKDWKIVPVGPRPFPAALRAGAPAASSPSPVPWPVAVIVAALAAALWLLVRRWRSKKPRAA